LVGHNDWKMLRSLEISFSPYMLQFFLSMGVGGVLGKYFHTLCWTLELVEVQIKCVGGKQGVVKKIHKCTKSSNICKLYIHLHIQEKNQLGILKQQNTCHMAFLLMSWHFDLSGLTPLNKLTCFGWGTHWEHKKHKKSLLPKPKRNKITPP
jgi:hypothetical protein